MNSNRFSTRRLLGAAAIAAAFVALTAGVAGAHKFHSKNPLRFDGYLVVSPESAIYEGEVIANGSISQDPVHIDCTQGRLVKIIHRGVHIATDRTSKRGKFSAVGPVPPPNDPVIAKLVKETLVDNDKHRHSCAGAKDKFDPNEDR